MTSEIVRASNESIKIGVADSQVASVRTQVEEETAVRVYSDGCAGLASAVGDVDLDQLRAQAQAGLGFEIAYPAQPSTGIQLQAAHLGQWRSVDELVGLTQEVLGVLTERFPQYVFGHGVEQSRVGWRIENELGLDLSYERVSTQAAFLIKEKGSGSIIDTFVGTDGLAFDAQSLIERFADHLSAYAQRLGPAPTGRQRIVFPGMEAHAGGGLLQLLRSDMVARSFGTDVSVFKPKQGQRCFSEKLSIVDSRDSEQWRVAPFDMEGVVRESLDHSLVDSGLIVGPVASKRDAARYGLVPTGSGLGSISQLPVTGLGKLAIAPTHETLVDLLDGEPALMPWFVAGGDCTRAGDLGMPVQVLMRVEADGTVSGRYDGCTLSGSVYETLGADLLGISAERLDPDSEEPFLLTHMAVC